MRGFNNRLDNLQAAFLNRFFDSYDEIVTRRRCVASNYQEQPGDLEVLKFPLAPDSGLDHFDIFLNYEIEGVRREEVKSTLSCAGQRDSCPGGQCTNFAILVL